MNVKDILKKKAADRTEEEKDFLKKHRAEMSDAEKKQYDDEGGAGDDGDADDDDKNGKKKASEGADKGKIEAAEMVQISASELAILREKADKGHAAFAELEKNKLNNAVTALVFSESNAKGRFLPKSEETLRTFMEKLNDEQRTAFADLIGQLPEAKLFSEVGDAGTAAKGSVQAEVDSKVEKIMADDKVPYSEALKRVFAEGGKTLQDRYDAELTGRA